MNEKPRKKFHIKNARELFDIIVIVLLCLTMAILDFYPVTYTADEIDNRLISDTVPLLVGSVAVIWLMLRGKSGLFGKPQKLLFLVPCLLVAVDNFPFHAYLAGKSELVHTSPGNWLLFALYCAGTGIFEECVFRGILFPLLAGYFSADRKGFLKTFFLSSVIFGCMHVFNIFAGAGVGPTLLQVCYSTLTGGLFAFALIKTKNIFVPAFVHGLYNFCGLLLTVQPGLGTGSVFDWQTMVTMAVVGVAVCVFVLYCVWKYSDGEREELYKKLGFGIIRNKENSNGRENSSCGDSENSDENDSEINMPKSVARSCESDSVKGRLEKMTSENGRKPFVNGNNDAFSDKENDRRE